MKNKCILIVLLAFNLLFSHAALAESLPDILSEAAILIDAKTGSVLYEKNADAKMYPASLTKIATAIYALEHGDLADVATVSENARSVEGSRVYLEEGEKVQLKKLIQGLLINSGNDAGVAIAEHLHGSIEAFAANLNRYLKKIGLENTNFVNPHGLFDPNHVTTAEDMAKLTRYAIENQDFSEIFGTKELEWHGESWQTTIYTHHKLLREMPYEGATGGKTGYTARSRNTLVTTAERENLHLIAVVLKGENRQMVYNDTVNLLDFGFEYYQTASIPKGAAFVANGDTFVAANDFYYTQKIGEPIKKKVNPEGILEIVNENQELVASFPLENALKNRQNEQESREESNKLNVLYGLPFLFVLAAAILVLIRAKIRPSAAGYERTMRLK